MIPNAFNFLKVYNENLPNKMISFVFKYFSTSTLKKDKWLKNAIVVSLLILFSWGFFATISGMNYHFILYPILIYFGILAVLGILMFYGFIANNLRIRKIRKILGITLEEYDTCVKLYLIND